MSRPSKFMFIWQNLPFFTTQFNSTITAICSLSCCNGAVLFYSQHDNFERTVGRGMLSLRMFDGSVSAHSALKWNGTIAQGVVNARFFAKLLYHKLCVSWNFCFEGLLIFLIHLHTRDFHSILYEFISVFFTNLFSKHDQLTRSTWLVDMRVTTCYFLFHACFRNNDKFIRRRLFAEIRSFFLLALVLLPACPPFTNVRSGHFWRRDHSRARSSAIDRLDSVIEYPIRWLP